MNRLNMRTALEFGRPVQQLRRFERPGGAMSVFGEFVPFVDKLGRLSREKLVELGTPFPAGCRELDERSRTIPIRSRIFPFLPVSITVGPEYQEMRVNCLRVKGCLPQHRGGVVDVYGQGLGYCSYHYDVPGEHLISSHPKRPEELSALGTVTLRELEKEARAAIASGPGITDLLLGFGEYDLCFMGEPVYYLVYGMERKRDERMFYHLLKMSLFNGPRLLGAEHLARQNGKLLRDFHDITGYCHGYATLGNLALTGIGNMRLVDLESAQKLPENSALGAPYRYLDISRTAVDYMRGIRLGDKEISLMRLLPHFLLGYFGPDSLFGQELERLSDPGLTQEELESRLGTAPEIFHDRDFGICFRVGGKLSLAEPLFRASMRPYLEEAVDLSGFCAEWEFFGRFYEELKACSSGRCTSR